MSLDTLAAPARNAIEVKHSRFLAQAAPIATPEDAAAFLRQVAIAAARRDLVGRLNAAASGSSQCSRSKLFGAPTSIALARVGIVGCGT